MAHTAGTSSMETKIISQDQAYQRLDTPFNPPNASTREEKESFYNIWHQNRDYIHTILSSHWKGDPYGDGDYTLSENASLSRGFSIQLTSENILNHKLIKTLSDCLNCFEENYEIHISYEHEGDIADVFLNKEEVLVSSSDALVKRLFE